MTNIPEGAHQEYWKNGNLKVKCTYKDGNLDGPYEEYYENGKLKGICTFQNGKYNGLLENYYSNGQLKERCVFKSNIREGMFESYCENGQLCIKCTYKNGKANGPAEYYSKDGQLKEILIFKDGKKIDKRDTFLTPQEVLPDWEKEHPNPTPDDFLSYMYGTGGKVITCIVRAGLDTLDRFFPAEQWAKKENIPTLTKIFSGVPRDEDLTETMLRFDSKLRTTHNLNKWRAARQKQHDLAISNQNQGGRP